MALGDELNSAILATSSEVETLEQEIDDMRRTLAQKKQILRDALRLYESMTGSAHELATAEAESARERPRAGQVLAVLEAASAPVSLTELVKAMPDQPDRGAISAVVHRAIKKGEVRRLKRGLYELADTYPRAS